MEANFDFTRFIKRLGLKQKDAAELLKVSKGLVGMWASSEALPSFDKIVRLINAGMTAQELFGDKLGTFLIENSTVVSISPEYQEGYKKALEAMNEKGLLHDEILKAIAEMKSDGKL